MYGSLSLAPPLLFRKGDYLPPGRTHTRYPLFLILSLFLSLAPSVSLPIAHPSPTRTLTRYPLDLCFSLRSQTSLLLLIQNARPQTGIRRSLCLFFLLYLS